MSTGISRALLRSLPLAIALSGVARAGEPRTITGLTNPESAAVGPDGKVYVTVIGERALQRLLGVVDTTLYLATHDRIRAYDISDIQSPVLLPYKASVAFGAEPPRLLAADDPYLAVASAGGDLFLVPRNHPGTIAPLQVHPEAASCGR